jgi:hypothetical protein
LLIRSAHVIPHSTDAEAEADRAFLQDLLGLGGLYEACHPTAFDL